MLVLSLMINRDGTKKILEISLFLFAIGVVVVYTLFSFNDYLNGPQIIISSPVNGSTSSSSAMVIVGQALHIRDITLNNKPINIDTKGNFRETISLLPGYNVSMISATDKFKRTIEYKLELVYQD